jgi:hypothetical protein
MGRWPQKLWHAFLALWLGVVLLVFSYFLYAAWAYHEVFVSSRLSFLTGPTGWVSHDAHPVGFWIVVVFDFLAWLGMVALTTFLIWGSRAEEKWLRKRETRPPTDSSIRQTISER